MRTSLIPLVLCATSTAFATLGDTQETAEQKYGPPKEARRTPPLVEGAKELTFEFQGWRIRCALVAASDGREYVVREEYQKVWNSEVQKAGGTLRIHDTERDAVLRAEPGATPWRPRTLSVPHDEITAALAKQLQLPATFSGTIWLRDDNAMARMNTTQTSITLDLPQARKYELELKAIKSRKVRGLSQ
jgi:hypothetical protein